MDHLEEEEEMEVVRETTDEVEPELHAPWCRSEDMIAFQDLVRRVPVAEPVMRYAVGLVRASRPNPNGRARLHQEVGQRTGRAYGPPSI